MHRRAGEVLLVNPNLMKPPVTPVAIDFLSSCLRKSGYRVRFLDLAFEQDIAAALVREVRGDILFVGLTIRNIDDSFFASKDFCLAKIPPIVHTIKSLTDAPVVIGGVGYSIFSRPVLDFTGADFGICGDGEIAVVRLAEALSSGETPFHVPGLVWRSGAKILKNNSIEVDLLRIDLSDRGTVDNPRYYREGGMVGFETKRGCNINCTYCADPVAKGSRSRQRPPDEVAREVAGLAAAGIQHFQTCDAEFNVPYAHAVEVCRSFIRAGLGARIRWYAYMTPAYFDDELASLMARAGCAGINFGADHCVPQLLEVLGRNHTAESLADVTRLCRKYGIECMFDLILGAPGETPETLRRVIDYMKTINPSCIGICMGIRLYPKTGLLRKLDGQVLRNVAGIYGGGADNIDLLRPVYYLSPALGEDPDQALLDAINGDDRFFAARVDRREGDFNYNDNSLLSEAIRAGERGTFWDILRRLRAKASL